MIQSKVLKLYNVIDAYKGFEHKFPSMTWNHLLDKPFIGKPLLVENPTETKQKTKPETKKI